MSGPGAAAKFELEPGIHRVQRIPPTEKRGRRQTSTIAVAVLSVPKAGVEIRDSDLDIKFTAASSKGGQHANKNATAAKVVHRPTGISASAAMRSQKQSLDAAKAVIAARVAKAAAAESAKSENAERRSQIRHMGRGTRVRNYDLFRGKVKDERTGKGYQAKKIMDGGLAAIYRDYEKKKEKVVTE